MPFAGLGDAFTLLAAWICGLGSPSFADCAALLAGLLGAVRGACPGCWSVVAAGKEGKECFSAWTMHVADDAPGVFWGAGWVG
jgi:hypothetical protein